MRFLLVPLLLLLITFRLSAQIEPIDTDNNGYRDISLAENFLWISQHPDSWTFNYELVNDIDLSDSEHWNSGLGFSPIGNSIHPFSGQFRGRNYIISHLTINRQSEDTLGFFGVVSQSALINNLKFADSKIVGNSHIGIICGINSGLIDNIYASGVIIAQKDYIGGITALNYGTIKYISADIDITGNDAYCGGIAGENQGSISNSSSIGRIQSKYIIGGFVGNNSGTITDCYSRVDISAQENYIGGFAGSNWETGTITNCYSTGLVRGSGYYQGGLVGFKSNEAKDFGSFWDTDSSEIYDSMGGEGKTSDEMRNIDTYSAANWDFSNVWTISQNINDGYPYLRNKSIAVKDNENQLLLSITPNPASDFVDIRVGNINPTVNRGVDGTTKIVIYNSLGENVMTESIHPMTSSHRMNIEHLPRGIYFFRAGGKSAKFVKM